VFTEHGKVESDDVPEFLKIVTLASHEKVTMKVKYVRIRTIYNNINISAQKIQDHSVLTARLTRTPRALIVSRRIFGAV
jgi:hypothetical protein